MNQGPFPKLTHVKTLDARVGETRYGTPMPQILIEVDAKASYRHAYALAHLIAARLEFATPESEGWCISIDMRTDQRAIVWLDLVKANPSEVRRGLALVQSVVEACR